MIELINRADKFSDSQALREPQGQITYGQLVAAADNLAQCLAIHADFHSGMRIALSSAPGINYVIELLAIWLAGGIAVPINPDHPLPALSHMVNDSGCTLMISAGKPDLEKKLTGLGLEMVYELSSTSKKAVIPWSVAATEAAMILYTSGTTSLPKGVVITHHNLEAQMISLSQAWEWSRQDVILNVLPLHHVHGIVNVLCCALWNGATCEFLSGFDEEKVRQRFISGDINLFMAVPTIYYKLIEYWDGLDEDQRSAWSDSMKKFRLMVSGSAALPEIIHQKWQQVSGQLLLERYGMTETGMVLSNPYSGPRRPGFVGQPLPGIKIKVADEHGQPQHENEPGELLVQGPSVFKEYWNQPKITAESFDHGWFRTGDIVVKEQGYFRIMGRKSVDIIKTGGYKVSSLEIESVLLNHPGVKECAVVGLPDEAWGEVIVACVVASAMVPGPDDLIEHVSNSLAAYKKPRTIHFMKRLPRNNLGKVIKPELIEWII